MTAVYVGRVRFPPGRWFEVCRADSASECWRKLLDWSPPAGVQFDERKVERTP